jgi:uncharacterized protein
MTVPAGQPAKSSAALAPVAPEERMHALDLLRGWAMFGVLWSNLNEGNYGLAEPVTRLDRVLVWSQRWLIEGHFYTLLCLLFGVGFAIQLSRATERGADVEVTYRRRSLALLAIGAVHGFLIWNGDILSSYAMAAFALVLFRDVHLRRLLPAAFLLCVVGPGMQRRLMSLAGLQFPMPSPGGPTMDRILATGSWLQIEQVRAAVFLDGAAKHGLKGIFFEMLPLFLVGLWAMKSGYLRRVFEDPRTTRRLLLGSVAAAAIGYALRAGLADLWLPNESRATGPLDPLYWVPRGAVRTIIEQASMVGGSVAYAAGLLLLWQRPGIARVLRPLATTGRMGLTTYLCQSVVCTMLFYGYGLGWYGQVRLSGMLAITLAVYPCQMLVAKWWLSRFRFGPVEWIWRGLTYGRLPRNRVSQG